MVIDTWGDRARFLDRLDRFRREGCALLSVGELSAERWSAVAGLFLGDPQVDRHRVIVADDADRRTRLSSVDGAARCIDLEPSAFRGGGSDAARPLLRRIDAAFDAMEPVGGYDPGECRLWFPIRTVTAPAIPAAARTALLDGSTDAVLSRRGRGYYVLAESYAVARERGLHRRFDAVIEHRADGGGLEQRWRVPSEDLLTPWTPIGATRAPCQ